MMSVAEHVSARPAGGAAATNQRRLLRHAVRIAELARRHPLPFAAAAAGLTARAVFWAMTNRRWEDALITITAARNAALGHGLTHHQGEPVTQGYTSAISVLVPLVGELIKSGGGFFALRFMSMIAFVVTVADAYGIGRLLGLSRWPMFFVLAYLAFDENQIFYGIAGMETQIAVAVLLAGGYFLMRGSLLATGALLGLALLTRPDFILWVGPAAAYLLFRFRRASLMGLGLGGLVVFPWLVFTTLYYGSPEPNTIHAKALRYPIDFPGVTHPRAVGHFLWDHLAHNPVLWHGFTPLLENGLIVSTPFPAFMLSGIAFSFMVLALIGAWAARRVTGWWPLAAFGVVFVVYRVYFLPPEYYEWYLPPFMAIVALAAGRGFETLRAHARRTVAVAGAFGALAFSFHMPITFVLEARVQHDIEDRVRMPMGVYLSHIVQPGQVVVSESAGYVGYYGHVLLYDYPGLTSYGALRIMESLGLSHNSLSELANVAKAKWVIMRPNEWTAFQQEFPDTAQLYRVHREFDVPYDSSNLTYANVTYVNIDRDFLVLERRG